MLKKLMTGIPSSITETLVEIKVFGSIQFFSNFSFLYLNLLFIKFKFIKYLFRFYSDKISVDYNPCFFFFLYLRQTVHEGK